MSHSSLPHLGGVSCVFARGRRVRVILVADSGGTQINALPSILPSFSFMTTVNH